MITNENLKSVVPVLEVANGEPGAGLGPLLGELLDSQGRFTGQSLDGEEVIGRWFVVADLMTVMDTQGRGGRKATLIEIDPNDQSPISLRDPDDPDVEYKMVYPMRSANVSLAVTSKRVLGLVRKGDQTIDRNHQMWFSWPYDDMADVEVKTKTKLFGGAKPVATQLNSFRPMAHLEIAVAHRAAADGTPPSGAQSELQQLSDQVVVAAARHRLVGETDPAEQNRLQGVISGQRAKTDDPNTTVAWLTNPDD